jgi:hypothetical protein
MTRVQAILEEADSVTPDWDMIQFGASKPRNDISASQSLSENLQIPGYTYLTTFYAISPRGVDKFLEYRDTVFRNCLVFDELHNVLAGFIYNARPELVAVYGHLPRLNLLSTKKNLVVQFQKDGVHDTDVSAGSRSELLRSVPNTEPKPIEHMHLYHAYYHNRGGVVKWLRRTPGLTRSGLQCSTLVGVSIFESY